MAYKSVPTPNAKTSLRALSAMLGEKHPLAALQVFHAELGDVFRVNLLGFSPIFLVGPQAARFVLAQKRGEFLWRNENDPVSRLLQHGVLVEDGQSHDDLRHILSPALHRRMLSAYISDMWKSIEQVAAGWQEGQVVDMLVEMRKIALLSLMRTLYRIDFTPVMKQLWDSILGCIGYISPGLWMFWPGIPRPQYLRSIHRINQYLYQVIIERRKAMSKCTSLPEDLLGVLIYQGLEDDLIRDQLLTMLIAGHDTVTALLAWTLYLLAEYPESRRKAQAEVDMFLPSSVPPQIEHLNNLEYLGWVIKESLRLYPPIHLGNRLAAEDLEYEGFLIPRGSRVIYSIYLTQRHPAYWDKPNNFQPERYASDAQPPPYTWLAFGGGPRNCIGVAYGQMEAKITLAYILRRYEFDGVLQPVSPRMGATLEPRPGVKVRVRLRK